MMTKDEEWTDWMWYKLWSRCLVSLAQSLIYIPDIWLCHSVTSCHYINWGNLNYKIYFRSWEARRLVRSSWRNTFDYEQNRTIVLFMSFLSAKWQIKSWNSWQASFACGIQARPVGGHNILLARCKYYLLPRQRYHRNWVWQFDISHL